MQKIQLRVTIQQHKQKKAVGPEERYQEEIRRKNKIRNKEKQVLRTVQSL